MKTIWFAMAVLWISTGDCFGQTNVRQSIPLSPGWNLITFQVLPTNANPSAVFGTNLFKSAWTFDNSSGDWFQYGRTSPTAKDANQIKPMRAVELGRGYLVNYDGPSGANWVVTGNAPTNAVSQNLRQGWNLLGVPGQTGGVDLNILSVFKPGDLDKIQFIARWDAAQQAPQLYDPKNAISSQFQFLDPNLAHWILATAQVSIQPEMVVEAPGDSDLLPLHVPAVSEGQPWIPGPEDISHELPGARTVFRTRATKTAIRIPKGQDSFLLPLYNRGGGILIWNASFLPRVSQGGAIGLNSGEVTRVLSLAQSSGLTSSETDTLKIFVDRTHLSSGIYLAQLKVVSPNTSQTKTFDLVLDVGGLDGQWRGTATIQTVNGKSNTVADVDLFVHLFQDNKAGSRQLRGIIDSRETLLWPIDAQLLGHIIDSPAGTFDENYASRFVISGGYTMAPGDVNRFPFETFPTNDVSVTMDQETGLEFRTNPEGDRWYYTLSGRDKNPNFLNPFPKFISREVEFDGRLIGSEGGAAIAEGDYYETITGMMPKPIYLKGTFRLTRKTASPLEKRPYKYFDLNVPLGGLAVGSGNSASRINVINDHILINRLMVVVAQDADSAKHTLELISPSGVAVTLHDGQQVGSTRSVIYDSGELPIDPLHLLDPPELRGANTPVIDRIGGGNLAYENDLRASLASYSVRRPRGTNVTLNGFSDLDAFGAWKLRYQNTDSGATHKLLGWSLLVYGTPAYPIAGKIVVEGNSDPNRFQDVSVQVLGLNADLDAGLTVLDRATGQFSIPALPGLRVNVVATKPGYLPGTIEGLNTPSDPRGFRDGLGGVLIGGPGTTNVILTLRLPSVDSPMQIFTHHRNFDLTGADGVAPLRNATVEFVGSTPEDQICWELEWLGTNATIAVPSTTGRSPQFNLDISISQFTSENQFTLAFRPIAKLCSSGATLATGEWATVTLLNPTAPQNVSPYWNTVLVQGTVLQGFGAIPGSVTDGVDSTGVTALHAQKTDVAKVDVDRPPLISSQTNPAFLFDQDGLSSSGDGEDTDLHPRNFAVWAQGSHGNQYAYAEILETPDLRFARLVSPAPGQTPTYDDLNFGISGRDIHALNEPVRIFTALGGRFCNLGVSSTDGKYRISAGANPGKD
jgi:hypothetical protein